MTNQGPVEGMTVLVEQDFSAAWRFVPTLKTARTLGLLGGLAYPLLLFTSGVTSAGSAVAAAIMIAVLLAGVWFFALRAAAKKLSRKSGGGSTRYELHPSLGFSVQSTAWELRLAWSSLVRFVETPDSFLVYAAATPMVLVPKRAFSADDTARARQLLAEHVAETSPTHGRRLRIGALVFFVFVAISSVHHRLRFAQPPAGGDDASSAPEH